MSYRAARAIQQKLADANPAVTLFQSNLRADPQSHWRPAVQDR